ncbi:MAG: DUF4215 domain-containing protein [Myxococcota bacterium]
MTSWVRVGCLVLFGCGQLGFDLSPARDGAVSDEGALEDVGGTREIDGAGTDGSPDRCGDGVVSGPERCDPPGERCSPDCLQRFVCGDGLRTADEACDDGNAADDDGCDNDCTFSCTGDEACNNGELCDGVERCDVDRHVCVSGVPLEGDACTQASGGPGTCRAGACAPDGCGDGVRSGDEQCDDGNTMEGDGCDNDCTFSCIVNGDCDDGLFCNGLEECDMNVCFPAAPLADGSACDRDDNSSTRDICLAGSCAPSFCGDGFVDAPEACDDGNDTEGDGCKNDCQFTCVNDADCDDGVLCNGAERCAAERVCAPGTPAPDGTPCAALSSCQAGSCQAIGGSDGGTGDLGLGGESCGTATCVAGSYCCNLSCNLCAPDGVGCSGKTCDPPGSDE